MTPLWFFSFAKEGSLFANAMVAAPSRARACDLLEAVVSRTDPANSVALRKHPTRDHLWTGEDVALVCAGQADVAEGVIDVTVRASGDRMLYLGESRSGNFVWQAGGPR